MTLAAIDKTPDDHLDYDVGFERWLPDGDRIVSAVTTIAVGTATISATDVSDDRVKVWVAGGTAGDDGEVTVIATTEQGRTKEVCFRLRVKEC